MKYTEEETVLLDTFAAEAMAAHITRRDWQASTVASIAYLQAEEMLKVRKQVLERDVPK